MNKIGIVIVNYNGLSDTIECIDSIYKSDYKEWEIIVIDNNSLEAPDILESYDKVTLKKLSDNVGFGIANNIGAQIAIEKGADFIFCLNNDTTITKGLLSLFLQNIKEKTVLTCSTYYYSDKNELWYGGGEVSRFLGTFRHKKYKENRYVSFASGCCIFIPKKLIMDIGLFSKEYFMYYEDGDFSLKILRHGYRIYYLTEESVFHKIGKSISKVSGLKEYYLTRNRLYLLNKYKGYFYFTAYIYFFITRCAIVLLKIIRRESIFSILEGYKDYKRNSLFKRTSWNE